MAERWHKVKEDGDPKGPPPSVIIQDENGAFICEVHPSGDDADLITAAPDLQEACEALVSARAETWDSELAAIVDLAAAAICKSLGEADRAG